MTREIWHRLATWSDKTFGNPSERGPEGPIKHLKKECEEALQSPKDLMEYADMNLLVLDACRRAGFTKEDLDHATIAKLAICEKRTYPKPGPNEVSEHIR